MGDMILWTNGDLRNTHGSLVEGQIDYYRQKTTVHT